MGLFGNDSEELREKVATKQEKITGIQLGDAHAAKCRSDYKKSFKLWPVGGKHPYVQAQEDK